MSEESCVLYSSCVHNYPLQCSLRLGCTRCCSQWWQGQRVMLHNNTLVWVYHSSSTCCLCGEQQSQGRRPLSYCVCLCVWAIERVSVSFVCLWAAWTTVQNWLKMESYEFSTQASQHNHHRSWLGANTQSHYVVTHWPLCWEWQHDCFKWGSDLWSQHRQQHSPKPL